MEMMVVRRSVRLAALGCVVASLGASLIGCRTTPPSIAPAASEAPARVAAAPAPVLPPVACKPDGDRPLAAAPARRRLCVIDVGSRNVKLVVASLADNDGRTLTGERVCRSRLQLGEKTFDQKTQTARPLAPADRQALAHLLGDYSALCGRDGGQVTGAVATEWARRATNPDEIRADVKSRAGIDVDILSRDREARFGYLAATRGARGKLVLDFGSRSVQLTFWARGAAAPEAASLPLGIDEAGDRFFSSAASYGQARAAYVAALRSGLATTLGRARTALRAGTLAPELFSLAENGDVPLALEGKLWDGELHGVDEPRYAALLKARPPGSSPTFGTVTAVIPARDLLAFGRRIEESAPLFAELRSDRIKRIYGYKMLAVPAVVGALADELGLETLVLVPQEMPDGVIIDRLP
jgi:hypothetical protein